MSSDGAIEHIGDTRQRRLTLLNWFSGARKQTRGPGVAEVLRGRGIAERERGQLTEPVRELDSGVLGKYA